MPGARRLKHGIGVVAAVAMLAGCGLALRDSFMVEDPQGQIAGGTLSLCGQAVPLDQVGEDWHASARISCEGSGEIRLVLAGGGMATCQVGYVTPGSVQDFLFRLQEGECRQVID